MGVLALKSSSQQLVCWSFPDPQVCLGFLGHWGSIRPASLEHELRFRQGESSFLPSDATEDAANRGSRMYVYWGGGATGGQGAPAK